MFWLINKQTLTLWNWVWTGSQGISQFLIVPYVENISTTWSLVKFRVKRPTKIRLNGLGGSTISFFSTLGSSFTVVDFFCSDDFDLDLSSFVAADDLSPLSFFFLDAASSPLELALLESDEESDDFERDLAESSLELELQIKLNINVMF